MDESAPLAQLPPGVPLDTITDENYGPLKVQCEQAVLEGFGARAFLPRPGYIVGMYDPTDRFTYWPHRVAQGGEVLAPAGPGYALQFIDVRDLAAWMLRMIVQGAGGPYNLTGPERPLPLGQLLDVCRQVSGSDACITWVPESDLFRIGAQPWIDLPMWEPTNDPQTAAIYAVDCSRAIASGLAFRPLAETVRETLAWDATRPPDYKFRFGMDRQRERELLDAYHGFSGGPDGG
jgi:2'-hydroxyisoflavone reductase